jgi:2-hydroxychromene-2-carboxylate isomerase
MPRVDFYFDYISPYSYLAWVQIRALCAKKGADLVLHPTLFAGLLNHWGQLGPAEIEPKRRWIFSDAHRTARLHGLPFSCPKYHPFNPLSALRLTLAEVAEDRQHAVCDTLFHAGWGAGIDLGSSEEICRALDERGLPGQALIEKTGLPEVKEALKRSTAEAIERGVFGVPTMIVGQDLFWGSDRMDFVALALDGDDPIDRPSVDAVLSRPKAADRLERKRA